MRKKRWDTTRPVGCNDSYHQRHLVTYTVWYNPRQHQWLHADNRTTAIRGSRAKICRTEHPVQHCVALTWSDLRHSVIPCLVSTCTVVAHYSDYSGLIPLIQMKHSIATSLILIAASGNVCSFSPTSHRPIVTNKSALTSLDLAPMVIY